MGLTPPAVTLRAARPDDLDALTRIHRDASLVWDDTRDDLLAHPEVFGDLAPAVAAGRVRVAVDAADRVLGFTEVRPTGAGRVELEGLFVAPEAMRQGIGAHLVADVVAANSAAGGGRLEVTANANALAFYRRVGFTGDTPVPTRFTPGVRMAIDVRPAGAG